MRRGLVLAGGGYVASSWEIGLLIGMSDAGLDVSNADLLVGTSAGARVALDLTGGRPLEEIYRHRVKPDDMAGGRPARPQSPGPDRARITAAVYAARQAGGSTADVLRRYGALALELASGATSDRRAAVAAQLGTATWPERNILITAVSVETGERRAFDRTSGIDIIDAVIATTASFGAPPIRFSGQHYFDGGYYSSDNCDLATGCERVLVLALRSPPEAMRLVSIEDGVAALRAAGTQVEVIHPDDETLAALTNAGGQMNPVSAPAAAIAGRHQGRAAVEAVRTFWH